MATSKELETFLEVSEFATTYDNRSSEVRAVLALAMLAKAKAILLNVRGSEKTRELLILAATHTAGQ